MGYSRLGLLLLSSALSVNVAQGQDASGSGDPLFIGTIRIESAPAQALLGNDIITEEELEGRNPSTVQDVYAGESSVTVSGGAAIGQKVFVNGIEESLLSVTIDGARQNKSAFHHTGNVLLDPELLKSVEVSEGLAPADAGPGALAGSIAYTTKDASDLLEDGDNFGGRVSFGTGTNGTGFRTNLALYGQQSGFEYLLSATRQKGDDYEDGDGVRVVGTEADLTDYVAKFAFTSQAGHKLSFAASQTEDTGRRAAQRHPRLGLFFIRPDFFGLTGGPSVLLEGLSRRTSYTLTYTNDQLSGWLNPTVQLSYNEQEIDAIAVYGTNESFSGVVKNEFQLGNGTVTAGFDFFDESAKGIGRGPGPLGGVGRESMVNVGVFAQARQDLSDRVSVSYGARFDWQEFDAADGSQFSGSGLSANGSVDVILNDQWTFNAGLASSWGGYELGEAALINFGTPWSYNGFTTSRANAARVGLRYNSGPWEASGALFYTEVNDMNQVLPLDRRGYRGAKDDLTSKGYNLSLGYNWSEGFARMNYTYANVKLDGSAVGSTAYYLGRPLGRIMALEAGWDVSDSWRVGGTAEIVKDGFSSTFLPSYEVVNLYATYKPRQFDNMEVRLDVRNLLDETYVRRSSDGIDSSRVIPLNEPGRTIGLTASFKF